MMPPARLVQLLLGALTAAGFVATARNSASNPFEVSVEREGRLQIFRVFMWRVTHGGASRSPNEFRVQVTRPGGDALWEADSSNLLLGYDEDRGVFVAWSPEAHADAGVSSSLQVPLELLEAGEAGGLAIDQRRLRSGDLETRYVFRPDAFGEYLELTQLVDLMGETEAEQVVAAIEPGVQVPEERRKVVRQVRELVRSAAFRAHVRDAYVGKCAMCGTGLGICQAAHVVPVSEGGSDDVANGILLCPNHHAAFDRGFLTISDEVQVSVEKRRIAIAGFDLADAEALTRSLVLPMAVPDNPALRPALSSLQRRRGLFI